MCGTPVQAIIDQKDLTWLAGGSGKVKIWPKITPILPLIAPYCDLPVAFPNRKSYFFDNKLEFSDIKIAIGQGFR